MRLIFKLKITLTTVFFISLIFFVHCQPLLNPTDEDHTVINTQFDHTIGIIVNKDLYPLIKSSIDGYAADLAAIEGKKVWIDGTTFDKNSSIVAVHDSLAARYSGGSLEGVVFIGDLPAAYYEIKADLYQAGYVAFPIELYFMDLDGIWYDTARAGSWGGNAKTGVFDGRSGNYDAEIWVSRIAASTMEGREDDIVKKYFERVHNRMHGNDTMPERAVLFHNWLAIVGATPWQAYNLPYNPALCDTFTNYEALGNGKLPLDTKENWIAALRSGYEYAMILEHGSTNLNQFNGVNFSIADYNQMATEPGGPANVRFYNLASCGNGLFTGPNIGTYYALGQNGLLSICSAKSGGMIDCYYFYSALANGESFGNAFKYWCNNYINEKNGAPPRDYNLSWSYGMALMGAGSLKLHTYTKDATHQLIITQNTGGSLNRSGRIIIDDGDTTTITITPENRHQIECVLVDGDTIYRKKYPKFPYAETYYNTVLDNAGRTLPLATSYTFRKVQSDHSMVVVFSQRPEYKVTITALPGGFVNKPPRGNPDTSCHTWSGLFYEGDVLIYGVGTLFSIKPASGIDVWGTNRWSYDSASLSKTISMVADMGGSITEAIGRPSFSDTVQVFRDHYIVAAFEPKKVFEIKTKQEGARTCDTSGGACYQLIESADILFQRAGYPEDFPSGDCVLKKSDTTGETYLIRDGEDMALYTRGYNGYSLVDVQVDNVSAGQQVIIRRYPEEGIYPEQCYVHLSKIDASHEVKFVFSNIVLP